MPTRIAHAEWKGDLLEGSGHIKTGSGAIDQSYDWRSRSADGAGTNPEELIAAAHAGCFSMALSATLGGMNFTPTSIQTSAKVTLEKQGDAFVILTIELTTVAEIPGISDEAFQEAAASAKANCPVSKALAGVEIVLSATLK